MRLMRNKIFSINLILLTCLVFLSGCSNKIFVTSKSDTGQATEKKVK
ncbi:hypothetical protein LAL01_12370 [Companilactobacillus alimentarius]|nr:hypothetical protein LAL01_12370 [Companilactobacillus alimentarius]